MYYFEDVENQKELKAILDSWVDTPYRHHCGVKGLGCDCMHLLARVFQELGLLVWRKNMIPEYPPDWHLHNTEERLLQGIKRELDVEEVSNLRNGDIMLFHFGKASSHSAIYFDGHIYQAETDIGVRRVQWPDRKWAKRRKYTLRVRSAK